VSNSPSRFTSFVALATLLATMAAACSGPAPAAIGAPTTGGAQTSGPEASAAPPSAPASTAARSGPFADPLAGRTVRGVATDVSIVLEDSARVAKLMPVEGGSISATGEDGSAYSLTFPSDALLVETEISLTPVARADGLPFGGDRTYAVQLGPDGLRLNNYAVLTITPATPIDLERQVMFEYLHDGRDVILASPVIDSREIKINVLHFSGSGVTDAQIATDREILGAYAERQLQDAVNETMGYERQHSLLCDTCPPTVDPGWYDEAAAAFDEQVVKPRVAAAGDSCEAGKLALNTVLGVGRQSELIGRLDSPTYPGLIDRVARMCVIEEFEDCVEHHRFFLMLPLYMGLARQQELGHFYSDATMAEARELTSKCLTFRLEFESTGKEVVRGTYDYESSVIATIMLRFNPATDLVGGNADYTNTDYEMHAPNCAVTTTPGGGLFRVFALLWDVDPGQPDRHGGYPDAQIGDFTMAYMPDISHESAMLKCPGMGAMPMALPAWSLAYYGVHEELFTKTGLVNQDWEIEGGELFATKEWDMAKDTFSEAGEFELYHVPGE
jgi:hypothetical protein